MHGAVDNKEGSVTAAHNVAHFSKTRRADFHRRARHAVSAAHFLDGSGRDGEELSAHTEQDDLFCFRRTRLRWGRQTHYRTPAGVVRQIPKTRFSMAA